MPSGDDVAAQRLAEHVEDTRLLIESDGARRSDSEGPDSARRLTGRSLLEFTSIPSDDEFATVAEPRRITEYEFSGTARANARVVSAATRG